MIGGGGGLVLNFKKQWCFASILLIFPMSHVEI